jgi:hypothetical protein
MKDQERVINLNTPLSQLKLVIEGDLATTAAAIWIFLPVDVFGDGHLRPHRSRQ